MLLATVQAQAPVSVALNHSRLQPRANEILYPLTFFCHSILPPPPPQGKLIKTVLSLEFYSLSTEDAGWFLGKDGLPGFGLEDEACA